MFQEKTSEIPVEIKAVRLEKWFSGLSDQDRIKLRRYLSNVVVSSEIGFFMDIIKAALADENYSFAVMMCQEAYNIDITEIQMFFVNEELIDAYIGAERYEDAKAACDANLKLYPVISKEFIKVNGGKLPEKINFRNRMIDVLVGIEFNYDKAYEMLDTYFRMNLISEEDLLLRKQSLRTHRLQRSFDSIYTYRPVNDLKN